MFNDQENGTIVPVDDAKFTNKIKLATIMTVVLAICRILSFDIMLMISDLLTALMLYFFSQSRNQCMAIFTGINGGIGIIYACIKFFSVWNNASDKWFSLYYSTIALIAVYAIFVYSFIIYLSYTGYKKYQGSGFGFGGQSNNNYNVSSNYGAITNAGNNNFQAFSGKGTTTG